MDDDIPPTHSPAADQQANNRPDREKLNDEDEDFDLLSRLSTAQEGRDGRGSEMKFVPEAPALSVSKQGVSADDQPQSSGFK